MRSLKGFFVGAIFLSSCLNVSFGDEVKVLIPSKWWELVITVNKFEPFDVLPTGVILGGETKDGITVSITMKETAPGTNASEIRKTHGQEMVDKQGQKDTVEEIDINDIAVIAYKLAEPNSAEVNDSKTKKEKSILRGVWCFHGYIVREDFVFDVNISADAAKHSKKEILLIIKSVKIRSTEEIDAFRMVQASFDPNDHKKNEKMIQDFIKKYPGNADVQFYLGEIYYVMKDYKQAKKAYLEALEKHKSQPIVDTGALFMCYDGMGLCNKNLGDYREAKKYFEHGYNMAARMKDSYAQSASAYNLAGVYAQTGNIDKGIQYLEDSIKLAPAMRDRAKEDASFKKIKDDEQFKKLIEGKAVDAAAQSSGK